MRESASNKSSVDERKVRVLVVDDDPTARRLMKYWLENAGYEVLEAATREEAEAQSEKRPQLACVDLGLGAESGIFVIQKLRSADPSLTAIVVTAQREAESAVAAMRAGAYDYVTKPLEPRRLLSALERALERHRSLRGTRDVGQMGGRFFDGPLLARSKAMREVELQAQRILSRDVPVVLEGEPGSGKTELAQVIGRAGTRASGPFLTLDLSSLPPEDQERALIGYEHDGQVVRGALEHASGGVLFLDPVDRLVPAAQKALARFLSGQPMERVPGAEFRATVRVVAGAERDLRALYEAGEFDEGLYFRLSICKMVLPPLRQRGEDLAELIAYYLHALGLRVDSEVRGVDQEAMQRLSEYSWPGNLAELENVLLRAMIQASSDSIGLADLPSELLASVSAIPESTDRGPKLTLFGREVVPLRDLERMAIEHALKITGGSVSIAAKRLGIGRATLYRRIASLDLTDKVA